MRKLLTVFGATGQQGGNLIDYTLSNPELSRAYKIRGITRDPSKPAAVEFQERGVEMVKADMDDEASLKLAVAGSFAVFAVTNFWEKASAAIEIAQGKAMADAAVAAGASLLIWSTLPNVTKMTDGTLTGVVQWDSKADNINGDFEFAQTWNADTRIPLIDIKDTGKYLAPALLNPKKYSGKIFTAATAYYTGPEMADTWTKVTGKKVRFVQIPGGTTKVSLPPEMMRILKDSLGLIKDYEYYGPTGEREVQWTLEQIEGKASTWEEFVRAKEPWFEL
ncbi:hypothetical protein OEA41_009769 [Lepraria neglecta]|uniref:NmrA-like domain-containing protein n=1 Tax=Lepraria neglecta TaxID=209136 RepID=A0AAE0DEN9_9LECA|nr:hypothetical protein OEA41_009769 [Lepraria neglecta]